VRWKRYRKEEDYSYTLGLYPTIELLKFHPNEVLEILVHSKFSSDEGLRLLKSTVEGGSVVDRISALNNDLLIESLSPKENCFVVGVFKKYKSSLSDSTDHLVLHNPSNAGNLGTIMRSMLAFGMNDLVLIKPATDIFNPEVVRASMGALFSLNFSYFSSVDDYIKAFPGQNLYLFMTDGSDTLENVAFHKPFSLIFGNESSGLPDSFKELGKSVKIEQSDKVDSLNLAVSVGIVLHVIFTRNI